MRASESRLGPEEEPRAGRGRIEEIPMTGQDRAIFLEALAETYSTATRADRILDAIDFPARLRPPFTTSPEQAWNDIFREIVNGVVQAGFRRLLENALRVYGHNQTFLDLSDRYLHRPAGPPAAAPAPEAATAATATATATATPAAQEPVPEPEPAPTCHVIFRADTEDERATVRDWLERAGLRPVEVWSTPSSLSFQVASDDPGEIRRLLDRTDFGWTVVPPGAPDYLLRQIYVEGPDGRRFRIVDAPAQQTVGNVAAEVVDAYGPNFPGAKRPTVVDHVDADGSGRRVDPERTLHDEGVRDGDRLRVGFQATAAAVHPADREEALFRVKNQILAYAASHPDLEVAANLPLAPTEYRLEFVQPSFGPPAAPGEEPPAISRHVVVLMLGPEFPVTAPQAFWMTPIFHPNVYPNYDSPLLRENKAAGGLVCLGALDESYHASLDFGELCAMLRDIAAYRNYTIFKPDGTVSASGRAGLQGDHFDGAAAQWVLSEGGARRIAEIGGAPSYARAQTRGSYRNVVEPLETDRP
ncbi:effector-associated domain EAD1-containing protein [Spirillospora sp. NBC_00431]